MSGAEPQMPVWNPSESAVVDPPTGRKTAGWLPGFKPPAQYFNWFQNRVWQWLAAFQSWDRGFIDWDGKLWIDTPMIAGGPGVDFAVNLGRVRALKVDGFLLDEPAAFVTLTLAHVEGAPGFLLPDTEYFVYGFAGGAGGGHLAYELSTVVYDGTWKAGAVGTHRFITSFMTGRVNVSGTDYGVPIPCATVGGTTVYGNENAIQPQLNVYSDTITEASSGIVVDLSSRVPVDAHQVLLTVHLNVTAANRGVDLFLTAGGAAGVGVPAMSSLNTGSAFPLYRQHTMQLEGDRVVKVLLGLVTGSATATTLIDIYVTGWSR